jgi:hypothetical protein
MRFEGTRDYVATDDLKVAVNAAVTLRRPLLVKGEPGTGKTVLAQEVAKAIGAPLIEWNIKSTTKAHQGLYEYDAVARLRDGQLGDERVHDISNYIRKGKLWEAFTAPELPVLLIDEIDKADIEFPNDLLHELDRMEFFYEVREVPGLKKKPSTSELLDWLKLLLHEDMPLEVLQNRDPTKAIPPLHGALLKNEQDVMLFERLAFMAKRQGRS